MSHELTFGVFPFNHERIQDYRTASLQAQILSDLLTQPQDSERFKASQILAPKYLPSFYSAMAQCYRESDDIRVTGILEEQSFLVIVGERIYSPNVFPESVA